MKFSPGSICLHYNLGMVLNCSRGSLEAVYAFDLTILATIFINSILGNIFRRTIK